MAHNGNVTDYPLLLKQYQQFGLSLPPNVVWIDTQFVLSSVISVVAPLYNYPDSFHRRGVDTTDYLVEQLIKNKRTMSPGYHFPSQVRDLLPVNRGVTIGGVVAGTECEHKVLATGSGKRSLKEGDYFCFFQEGTLESEHNAYCDVIGLWKVIRDAFRTIYQGVDLYRGDDDRKEREFIVTRLLLHELLAKPDGL